jgi:hypothetical protein
LDDVALGADLALQSPLPDGSLTIVAWGGKQDEIFGL